MEDEPRPKPVLDPEGRNADLSSLNLAHLEEGMPCPFCGCGVMQYDGMLVLRCSQCGHHGDAGCFT